MTWAFIISNIWFASASERLGWKYTCAIFWLLVAILGAR